MKPLDAGQNVVLVRVGIDSGSGGMQSPLFADGSFEFLPIPDTFGPDGKGVDKRTYGNTKGLHSRPFVDYFPASRRATMAARSMHVDPEFCSFTYGDPTALKARFRLLQPGDLVVFYAGLQRWDEVAGWDNSVKPGLYLIGFFHVSRAVLAKPCSRADLQREFGQNFHVKHRAVFEEQQETLVLVKGDPALSRRFQKAHCISAESEIMVQRGGQSVPRPIKVLSPEAQKHFGKFDGHIAIERSSPRWVTPDFVTEAAQFVRSLK